MELLPTFFFSIWKPFRDRGHHLTISFEWEDPLDGGWEVVIVLNAYWATHASVDRCKPLIGREV